MLHDAGDLVLVADDYLAVGAPVVRRRIPLDGDLYARQVARRDNSYACGRLDRLQRFEGKGLFGGARGEKECRRKT
jgi:hypothetical protein